MSITAGVANENSDNVSVVDTKIMEATATLPVGDRPIDADVVPERSRGQPASDELSLIVPLHPVDERRSG